MITPENVRQLFSYDPETGLLAWLVDGRNQHQTKGAVAGCLRPDGKYSIGYGGKRYLLSRVVFLWMTGRWPTPTVDHIDCDQTNNRWSNLREATGSQNLHNMRAKPSASGLKGAILDRGKYVARIRVNYRNIHLGRFDSAADAHAAYVAAAKKYYGEFARAK